MDEKHKGVFEKVKDSGVWWVRWTGADGVRRKKKIGSYGNAVKVYERKAAEAKLGVLIPTDSKVKFAEIVADAIAFYRERNASWDDFEQRVKLALPRFGSKVAATISTGEIQQWLKATAKERHWSPGTRNRVKASLSVVFREAQRAGKVGQNPVRLVPNEKEPSGKLRFLSKDEEEKLRLATQMISPLRKRGGHNDLQQLDVALHTGMRRGEQFSLTWDRVDLAQGLLYLDRTKNGSSRYVHLNSRAKDALQQVWEDRKSRGFTNPHVFLTLQGKPVTDAREWFDAAAERAGVEDVTWHTLRHTFASRLVMAGVDLKTVQELMGHKTIQMTARYAHLAPEHKISALEKLV